MSSKMLRFRDFRARHLDGDLSSAFFIARSVDTADGAPRNKTLEAIVSDLSTQGVVALGLSLEAFATQQQALAP
jgi:hypothetical protein